MTGNEKPLSREVWALKMAVDELLEAHEIFDHATFYGAMADMNDAQHRMEAARRRTRLASRRMDSAMKQIRALDLLLDQDDGFNLEERTRL